MTQEPESKLQRKLDSLNLEIELLSRNPVLDEWLKLKEVMQVGQAIEHVVTEKQNMIKRLTSTQTRMNNDAEQYAQQQSNLRRQREGQHAPQPRAQPPRQPQQHQQSYPELQPPQHLENVQPAKVPAQELTDEEYEEQEMRKGFAYTDEEVGMTEVTSDEENLEFEGLPTFEDDE